MKLTKGKWYWMNDPGSNMHKAYIGKAKCIDPNPNYNHCGGPTYMFEFYDSHFGLIEGAFGLEDVVYEMFSENDIPNLENDVGRKLKQLEDRIEKLEKLNKL